MQATREQSLNYGCLVIDPESSEVRFKNWFQFCIIRLISTFFQVLHYVEKPTTFVSTLINCGVYLFTSDIFVHLANVFKGKTLNDSKFVVLTYFISNSA